MTHPFKAPNTTGTSSSLRSSARQRWFGVASAAIVAAVVIASTPALEARGTLFPYHESGWTECAWVSSSHGVTEIEFPTEFRPFYSEEWVYWQADLQYSRDGRTYYRFGYTTRLVAAYSTYNGLKDFTGYGSYWFPVNAAWQPYQESVDRINVPNFARVVVPRGYLYRWSQKFTWQSGYSNRVTSTPCPIL